MSRYTPIDLSRLPLPDAVEPLDFETILDSCKAGLLARAPQLAPVIGLESEPAVKVLEELAYRELLLRARVNDSVRAVHLATAAGADLDGEAARFGVARLTVRAAEPSASPPLPAIMETDDALRVRAQLALEGFTTAGPRGAYEFHALSADGRVRDVRVTSPAPGTVRVTLLSHEGTGLASDLLIGIVRAAVNADDVRPLCDQVEVATTTFETFTVKASVTTTSGPAAEAALVEAMGAVQAYLDASFRIGAVIRRSALFAALHRPGIDTVTLVQPEADVDPGETRTARCLSVQVTVEAPA